MQDEKKFHKDWRAWRRFISQLPGDFKSYYRGEAGFHEVWVNVEMAWESLWGYKPSLEEAVQRMREAIEQDIEQDRIKKEQDRIKVVAIMREEANGPLGVHEKRLIDWGKSPLRAGRADIEAKVFIRALRMARYKDREAA